MIDINIIPHPFATERVRRRMEPGLSVAAIIAQLQPEAALARYAHVYLNGDYVPRENWPRVKPKAGTQLSIRMVPMGGGGGGKNPLRTVMSIAIMAGTAEIGGMFAGESFMGIGLGKIFGTGLSLAGKLLLNALAPPPKPRFALSVKQSPTLFLQAAQNQASQFMPVPQVLGQHRYVPPLGAQPYTETLGGDQYLRMLFVWGYGPLNITNLQIGETPIDDFTDVQVETRQGYPDDPPITLYTNSIIQDDLQVTLTEAAGYMIRTTDTDADEISVDVTFPQGLFQFDGNDNKNPVTINIDVQYSPTGLDQWSAGTDGFVAVPEQDIGGIGLPSPYVRQGVSYTVIRIDRIVIDPASGVAAWIEGADFRSGIDAGAPQPPAVPAGQAPVALVERHSDDADVISSSRITDVRDLSLVGTAWESSGDFLVSASASADTVTVAAGGLRFSAITITASQSVALLKAVNFKLPSRGQYDVRVRRVTPDSTSSLVYDETVWTALRTIRYTQPVNMTGLAMTALRIKATDQLNGVVDKLNGVVQSILPDWTGSDWVAQPTSNPAAIYRYILQGAPNARPLADSRLDLDRLQAWHDDCAAASREFNAVIDYSVSVSDLLQDVAAAGRASPMLIDGKWSVVEDKPQTVPVQHFTPRNTYTFQGNKSFDDLPQALRVRFINRDNGWLQDEQLVFDDGYDATTAAKYETLELPGITSATQAWQDGRYHIATARLRPETYSFCADIEHIVCTRSDLIRFTHDVPLFGLMSARVKALTVVEGLIGGVTLDAAVEMVEGQSYAVRFRLSDGSSLVQSLTTVPGAGAALTFTTPVSSGPEAGDLALFGQSGQESVELIVKSITPQNDLSALITCVDAAPAVFAADAGDIPPFNSQITVPPELLPPPTPVLAQIQSGLEVMIRNADGSLTSRIVITLQPPVYNAPLDMRVLIRAQGNTDFMPATVLSATANSVSVTDVADGGIYDLQVYYVTDGGVLSAALPIAGYQVIGASAVPSDITGFNMNVLDSTAYLSWQPVADIDLASYRLRFAPQTAGVTWSSATDLVSQIPARATSVSVPAAVGTFLIKAVDQGGRLSANADLVVSTIAGLTGFNAVVTVTEDTSFAGAMTNAGVSADDLQLSGADSIDGWPDMDTVANADIGNAGLAVAGTYNFANSVDLGAVYTSRLTADMSVSGLDKTNSVDTWADIDAQESWDQTVDPSLWNVQMQLRATSDDPSAADWSDWMPFVIGDYSARAFQFRALLSSDLAGITPSITQLRVNVDMPDRTVSDNGIVASPAGTTVAFDSPFRATPAISVTAQDMATGDYYTIGSPSADGFTIRFFDARNTGISRTFDYLAKGYGQQN